MDPPYGDARGLLKPMKLERPLVVGGTGFLGLNIAQALQEQGCAVRITRRDSSLTFIPRKLKLPMVEASLDDEESLYRAMRGSDVVFCAAAHYPRFSLHQAEQVAHGVSGIRRALSAARRAGVARFVYTSSVTTIGLAPGGRPATEDDTWSETPNSVYFAVKLAMEREVRRAFHDGLPGVIVCPSGCLGRYDIKAGTGFFIVALATGTLPYLVDGPLDVIGVEDVARAHLAAARIGRQGARYIVSAHGVSTAELLAITARKLGVDAPKIQLTLTDALERNLLLEERCAASKQGRPEIPVEFLDMLRFGQRFDPRLARDELGLVPAPLDAVLDSACAWFDKSGYLRRRSPPQNDMETSS
jgi:dihydroflavonol-4-reductase